MSARTVVRWYWAGAPWNRVQKIEVAEGFDHIGDVALYETRDEAVAAQTIQRMIDNGSIR